jgi:small subunit ribosomal protein S17
MAEETPENLNEEVVEAAEGGGESTEALDQAAPATPAATRRDRLEQRRQARRAERAAAGPKTLEERLAEREAHRERNARQRRAYRAKQKAKRTGASGEGTPPAAEHGPGRPKTRQGVVVSAKPDKTITVRIDVTRRHRQYKKIVRESTTLHAHDERNEAHEGDTVRVVESRPLSRTKRWRLVEILERAR